MTKARSRVFAPTLALLAAVLSDASLAVVGPTGGTVVGGQAIIQQLNQETLIKQGTAKAIINWNAFSVLSSESVVFQQPSASSIALNRVLGNQISTILGSITANGQVWLINPNGVLFGKTATVNAAGILATTADIVVNIAAALNAGMMMTTGARIYDGALTVDTGPTITGEAAGNIVHASTLYSDRQLC